MDFHPCGDASAKRVSATVFTVVQQSSGSNQDLLMAKSRLSWCPDIWPPTWCTTWTKLWIGFMWTAWSGGWIALWHFTGYAGRESTSSSYETECERYKRRATLNRHVGTHENPVDIAKQTRQYHGELRLLKSNLCHSVGVSICAQHEKYPQKQDLGAIYYCGDKQTSATLGEASANTMQRNRELQRR